MRPEPSVADRLRDALGRARRLSPPDRRNPERWREQKSELCRDLARLLAVLERERPA